MKADRHRRFGDLADDIAARLPDRAGLLFGASRYTFPRDAARIDEAARGLIGRRGPARRARPPCGSLIATEWDLSSPCVQKTARFRARSTAVSVRETSRYVLAQSRSCFLITHDRSGPVDYAPWSGEAVSLPASGEVVRDPRYPLLAVRDVARPGHPGQDRRLGLARRNRPGKSPPIIRRACARAVDPARTGLHMYTSGTDRVSKGVVRTHADDRNVEERAFRMAITAQRPDPELPPLFHAFGCRRERGMSLVTGARPIVNRSFIPRRVSN